MPGIPAYEGQKQQDLKLEASLVYMMRGAALDLVFAWAPIGKKKKIELLALEFHIAKKSKDFLTDL